MSLYLPQTYLAARAADRQRGEPCHSSPSPSDTYSQAAALSADSLPCPGQGHRSTSEDNPAQHYLVNKQDLHDKAFCTVQDFTKIEKYSIGRYNM